MNTQVPSTKIVDMIFEKIKSFENDTVTLSNKTTFSQYLMVDDIKTHQNQGFFDSVGDDEKDLREFRDIVTAMVETTVSNIDIDTENFDTYADGKAYQAQSMVARSLLRQYLDRSNQAEMINDIEEMFVDDGYIVVRKISNKFNSGAIYKRVSLKNLYVIDQTAESLEDTDVIEKVQLNQSQLRKMKEWSNIKEVIETCQQGNKGETPYYEAFYYFGEMSREDLEKGKAELSDKDYSEIESSDEYIQVVSVVVRAKVDKNKNLNNDKKGVLVFIEEAQPEIVKISRHLEMVFYKPYLEAHYGKYNGRWLRQGYREIGMTYQNTANILYNTFMLDTFPLMSKIIYSSSDTGIAGRNVLSSIKNGQILIAKDLQVLNNILPGIAIFSQKWNENIQDCQRALKAFEVSTGESSPASASATAIGIQNQAVGRYYNFKKEKLGILFSLIYKRFVLKELLNSIDIDEQIEIIGDASFMEEYINAIVSGLMIVKMTEAALNGNIITRENYEQISELIKQDLLKDSKQFIKLEKEFFKDIEMYVRINVTNENFNKQNKITNGLSLLSYLSNPVIMQNPDAKDIVIQIASDLGYRIKLTPQPAMMQGNQMPTPQMPFKAESEQQTALNNAGI